MALVLKLTLSIGLVTVLLFTSDVTEVVNTIRYCDCWYFVVAMAISFGAIFIAALRWQILLCRFKPNIDYVAIFELVCLSWFYNFFVPGGIAGDLIRGLQCRKHQISGVQGVASVMVDRIIGLGSFILVGLMAWLFMPRTLKTPVPSSWVWAALAAAIFCGYICFNRKLPGNLRFLSGLSPSGYKKLKLFYDSIYEYKSGGQILVRALIAAVITALANIGAFYLLSRAAGAEVYWVYFLIYIPVITVLSYIPISYSGLGIRELCFVFLFGKVGMTADQALAVSIMYFGMIMILSLAGGIIFLISSQTKNISQFSSR